jgi:hypothetical protein
MVCVLAQPLAEVGVGLVALAEAAARRCARKVQAWVPRLDFDGLRGVSDDFSHVLELQVRLGAHPERPGAKATVAGRDAHRAFLPFFRL